MNDYCIQPPFISQTVPPLVMFEMGRDHKFYFQAYNDATDLDGDGQIDSTYKHSINYYGYFDPFKCYTHTGGAGSTDQFTPVSVSSNKFCTTGQWSGNVLNWLTMTRMDVLRKVLYGGKRVADSSTSTVLERAYVPQDAHSWGKELTGRLCFDGNATYTTPCSQNSDCNSGWTCIDKSNQLIGMNAADAPSACATSVTAPGWTTAGKIFVAKYSHPLHTNTCGDYTITSTAPPADCPECPSTIVINDTIFASYEPSSANLQSYYYIPDFGYNDATTNKDVLPTKDHGNDFNFFMVTEFNVANSQAGTWNFLIDSDDGAYMMIDGQIISNYPGCHARCYDVAGTPSRTPNAPATASVCSGTILGPTVKACSTNADCNNTAPAAEGTCQANTPVCAGMTQPTPQGGPVSLTAGYHRMIVRHSENSGQDGVRVWYKAKGDTTWTLFGTATGSAALTLRAPTVDTTNDCSITTLPFIESGSPVTGVAKRHLFCNTTLSNGGTPIMRYITNRTERMWQWSTMESSIGPSCGSKIYNNASNDNFSATSAITPNDRAVRVEVCKSGITGAVMAEDYEFERCKDYTGNKKPIGLLQKYGENVGGAKVCSKALSKTCSADSGCDLATEGLCIYKSGMYFGLFTTTYDKNKSGGMLRKNIGSILDEVNTNGFIQTSNNITGNIAATIDKFKIVDFDYPSLKYINCQFNDRVMNEGECRDWGNPLAEMMYESLRYFAGKTGPLPEFNVTTNTDGGITFAKTAWGQFSTGNAQYKPYSIYPSCAKPFILLMSDINTSFDDDQVPGSAFATYAEDGGLPALNMNVATLANTIGTTEGINNTNWFIGESSTTNNFICDAKQATGNLSLLRGICPEEPTKKGTFYSAAVAYYGKTQFKANTGLPAVNTFAVALSSPLSDLKFKLGGKTVTFIPVGKSVSGSSAAAKCSSLCTFSINNTATGKGLTISNCGTGAFCPTNAIVNVFFEDQRYDTSNNLTYARFRINYENYEQGNDYDMDALVRYEICTSTSVNQSYSFCSNALAADQIEIKVDSRAAAGSTDQALGFVVNGTTADGSYLVVKDADVGNTSPITTLPLSWQRTFSVSSTGSTAGILKNPLWYAAKWGGFEDKNGSGTPDQKNEWASNCTETDITKCNPDNYYLVNNPLELERQLDKALNDILARVSSGTAASILNNSEGSGANLLQAVFYPKKSFDESTEANWIGEIQNLWYYLDPGLQKTSIREDTDQDFTLHLKHDKVAAFYFDPSDSITKVKLFSDANGDGAADNPSVPDATVLPDDVHSLWKAGRLLWNRDLTASPRTIYTGYNSSINAVPQTISSLATNTGFQDVLQIPGPNGATRDTAATALINFVHGLDQTGMRGRKVTLLGCGLANCTREWKLGDIVSSTPKLISNVKLNNYSLSPPTGYGDNTYAQFVNSATYRTRGMVFVGGNDGMLHAFKLGVLKELTDRYAKAKMTNSSGATATAADLLGNEEWAFVPKNTVPYLNYLADPAYNHLYFVDKTASTVDASIGVNAADTSAACAADYSQCTKAVDGSTWRTVLIGGMGIGGAVKPTSDACTAPANCVKTPIANYGYSSYFALDVTDPAAPKYLWEIAPSGLGYSTTGPALVRIATKNAAGTAPDHTKNGKWFAVFASGPTGPIDTTTHEFKGQSDQNLQIFIVDLATGALVRTIDTGITNAFAGSLASSWIDTDRSNTASNGYYSDDAVYIGYVKKDTTTNTWTKGGVVRLLTKESTDPASTDVNKQWAWSTLIDNTGPVTTSITKLQDRRNKNLWIYFGTGRFFYKTDDNATTSQNVLYGVKEPCYSTTTGPTNDIDQSCTISVPSGLINQSGDTPSSTIAATAPGWYINLDAPDSSYLSERMITDPIASPAGAVFFTTFKPSADICKFGGDSFIWAANYATGGRPPAASIQGRALMQVSTGAFAEINLSTALTDKGSRKTHVPISGVPPTAQGLSLISNPPPVKKFLHVKEK
jgi:type IV pilus assembly protein PilY1